MKKRMEKGMKKGLDEQTCFKRQRRKCHPCHSFDVSWGSFSSSLIHFSHNILSSLCFCLFLSSSHSDHHNDQHTFRNVKTPRKYSMTLSLSLSSSIISDIQISVLLSPLFQPWHPSLPPVDEESDSGEWISFYSSSWSSLHPTLFLSPTLILSLLSCLPQRHSLILFLFLFLCRTNLASLMHNLQQEIHSRVGKELRREREREPCITSWCVFFVFF